MTNGKSLLLASLFSIAVVANAAEPIHLQLNSFSLRFQFARMRISGITYQNDVSSQDENSVPNGEFRISPLDTAAVPDVKPSHEGNFFFYDGRVNDTYVLPFIVDVPTDDQNNNHIPDIYEFGMAAAGFTDGLYLDPTGEVGTFEASWEKVADSTTGVCRIQFDFGLRFSHGFELYQYSGTFTPGDVGADGVGASEVALTRDGLDGGLTGTLKFKMEPNNLTFLKTSGLKNENSSPFALSADAPSVLRDHYIYSLLQVVDGQPNLDPAYEDWKEWSLMITDPNDTDGDGTPNIFEGPATTPATAPRLEIVRTAEGIRLLIHGDIGRVYTLENSIALPAWINPTSVTLTADPHTIDLPKPSAPTFWRMRFP